MINDWKLLSNEKPQNGRSYLCYLGGFYYVLSYYDGFNNYRTYDGEIKREFEIDDVIAWMEIPAVPPEWE